MSNIPTDLQYTRNHEWLRRLQSGQVEFGITDHAQGALGDLVYIDVPMGLRVSAGAVCGVVESVKAASDVYSPVSGKIVESNLELSAQPELVNQDPYGAGWLLRVLPETSGDAPLLSAAEYAAYVAEGN